MIKSKTSKIDYELKNLFNDIQIKKAKIDKKIYSERRISKAVARAIKQDSIVYNKLLNLPFNDDRRYSRRKK